MNKLFITIALLALCLFNAEAKKKPKPQDKTITVEQPSIYAGLQAHCDSLQKRLDNLQAQADSYVTPLFDAYKDNTPLDKLDMKEVEQAITRYESGTEVFKLIKYSLDFDAPAAIEQLRKRVEVATEVQNAYDMFRRKYTTKENDDANIKLMRMSKDKSIVDKDKTLCKNLAGELATDMDLRGKFAKFLNKFYKDNAVIPHQKAAIVAYEDLKNNFVNAYFDGDNVPETYALVHSIIAEMTKTLTNYDGSLRDEAKFKAWINKFVTQLSTK